MNITLKPEQEQFIQDQLAQGNYQSADEVIAQALKVLAQQQRDYAAWVEDVRAKVDEAAAELVRGDGIPSEVVLKLVQAKFQQARSHLTTDQTQPAIADDLRALFRQTQAIPGLEQVTEDDIAAEIAAYRIGCPSPNA